MLFSTHLLGLHLVQQNKVTVTKWSLKTSQLIKDAVLGKQQSAVKADYSLR
jgi:hypothetical protein